MSISWDKVQFMHVSIVTMTHTVICRGHLTKAIVILEKYTQNVQYSTLHAKIGIYYQKNKWQNVLTSLLNNTVNFEKDIGCGQFILKSNKF